MTEAEFSAAIAADPDDLALRLMAADWYEEHSQPLTAGELRLSVIARRVTAAPADNGPRLDYAAACDDYAHLDPTLAERAEFIRAQCELARLPCGPGGACHCFTYNPGACSYCRKQAAWDALCQRQQKLLELHGDSWALTVALACGIPATPMLDSDKGKDVFGNPRYHHICSTHATDNGRRIAWTFRRGFVDEVRCDLATWCGVVCDLCRTDGHHYATCKRCRGAGAPPGCGPAVVKVAPVTVVRLTDRESLHNLTGYWWYSTRNGWGLGMPCVLPDDLFDLPPRRSRSAVRDGPFASKVEADAALSRRCVRRARAVAHLSFLKE